MTQETNKSPIQQALDLIASVNGHESAENVAKRIVERSIEESAQPRPTELPTAIQTHVNTLLAAIDDKLSSGQ